MQGTQREILSRPASNVAPTHNIFGRLPLASAAAAHPEQQSAQGLRGGVVGVGDHNTQGMGCAAGAMRGLGKGEGEVGDCSVRGVVAAGARDLSAGQGLQVQPSGRTWAWGGEALGLGHGEAGSLVSGFSMTATEPDQAGEPEEAAEPDGAGRWGDQPRKVLSWGVQASGGNPAPHQHLQGPPAAVRSTHGQGGRFPTTDSGPAWQQAPFSPLLSSAQQASAHEGVSMPFPPTWFLHATLSNPGSITQGASFTSQPPAGAGSEYGQLSATVSVVTAVGAASAGGRRSAGGHRASSKRHTESRVQAQYAQEVAQV